jgi:hypothetical protein
MRRAGAKVTFGMIVLNGMPFITHNLRAVYPYAHQIVVVEGAEPGAARIATPDGHSRDGTLEELRRFGREEDPAGKLSVVSAEDEGHDSGFWPGEKDEQSRAYATRATGDYIWQVDVDEFYMPADMQTVVELLDAQPCITAITFPTLNLWAGLGFLVDGWYLRRGAAQCHRVFSWGPGYTYATHRPPTVLDANGRDVRAGRWLDARQMADMGVHMYHYSLLFPTQVREKVEYYSNWGLYEDWFAEGRRWYTDSYLTLRKPYRVHNVYRYPSWLEAYRGPHPPAVVSMMASFSPDDGGREQRPTDDAERLLRSGRYVVGRWLLKIAEPVDRRARRARRVAGTKARDALVRFRRRAPG